MNDTPDPELLRRYAEQGADAAFTELVRRHCDLVWAAARRVSGDADLARDVAQTVFTDLARKAGNLPPGTVLAGWLYRAACHAAAKHIRGETRRAQRERQAMQQNELRSGDDAEARAAAELQPVLDSALADLPEADRDAVVLRFLAGRSFTEVGATLGTNEDAAQKRVSRALEKLRDAFRKRGVTVGGGIVAAALGVAGTQAAPAGMAAAVAAGALAGAGATAGAASFLLLMKTKLTLGIVAGAVVTSALAWQQRNISRLADENAGLRQQVATPTTASATPSASDVEELARFRDEHAELLRLRGEVTDLRGRIKTSTSSITGPSMSLALGSDSRPQMLPGQEFSVIGTFVLASDSSGKLLHPDLVLPPTQTIKAVQIGKTLRTDELHDRGDESPAALVETVLSAAKGSDGHRFNEILSATTDALPMDAREEDKRRMMDRITTQLEGGDKIEFASMTFNGENERGVLVRLVPDGPFPGPHINFQVQQENGHWRLKNYSWSDTKSSRTP